MKDSQIVALFWDRSEKALAACQERYTAYCTAIARNIVEPSDADECVNDTWLAAWDSIPPHRPEVLSAYLGKLTRRIALKRQRALHARKRGGSQVALALEELSACIAGGGTPEQAVEGRELARAMDRFVQLLPQTERRVFLRRYWYLDPIREIADRYGFTESKVKSMLLRTRQKLSAYLRKEGLIDEI